MSVYVSKRNISKVQFLETARKLSAHTLTYCLKAPKRLTFFLTKDICALARKVYYEATIANCIRPQTKEDVQNRRLQLDHYIKDKLKVKYYGRYVDDFYFFANTLKEARDLLEKIRQKVSALGLSLNDKKTRIQKFASGFKFLKTNFFCTDTGKIIRKINRNSTIRMKRKLKKFKTWVDEGKMTMEQLINSYQSWKGHMKRGNSFKIIKMMDVYFKKVVT